MRWCTGIPLQIVGEERRGWWRLEEIAQEGTQFFAPGNATVGQNIVANLGLLVRIHGKQGEHRAVFDEFVLRMTPSRFKITAATIIVSYRLSFVALINSRIT